LKEKRWVMSAAHACARALLMLVMVAPWAESADAASCDAPAEREVQAALAAIERSVDPCGASAELRRVVDAFRSCWGDTCRVCVDRSRERNTTERGDPGEPITITWNPELRTELERGCGDAATAVRRDPIASLAHELVHVAQAVSGSEFGETDAVRVENIYRRANGLCQRTRYGADPLPRAMLIECTPEHCACRPDRAVTILADRASPGDTRQTAGDVAGAPR
jgi:hypothetical protein